MQQFPGLSKVYRLFILNYSHLAAPFHWIPETKSAFLELKRRFTLVPVLNHSELHSIVEVDASDTRMGAMLS